VTRLRIPSFGNRVVLAAGQDAHTGSSKLKQLLDSIEQGQEPPLTLAEYGSLSDIHAGKFKRGRGEHKSQRRLEQGMRGQQLLRWLRQLKQELQRDPAERALKRALRGSYTINRRVAERAHELLQQHKLARMKEYGEDFVDYEVPSVAALMHRLKRN